MLVSHLLLAAAWILYCVLHSVLASVGLKRMLQKKMGPSFGFYRFAYTLFAFFSLVAVLLFQFRIRSELLFVSPNWLRYVGVILMVAGAMIMFMMIWKYFMQLSGVRWLYKEEVPIKLEITGLH